MRNNEEIIRQAESSRTMMDFYMIQMEILLDIRTLVKELVEVTSTSRRMGETKPPPGMQSITKLDQSGPRVNRGFRLSRFRVRKNRPCGQSSNYVLDRVLYQGAEV